jgi:tRNA uridine 5-carboxymethylaminomethyl modification enzyme
LRQDNADLRLTELSYHLGLASQDRAEMVKTKKDSVSTLKSIFASFNIDPQEINPYFQEIDSALVNEKQKAAKLLLRPNVTLSALLQYVPRLAKALPDVPFDILEQAEIQMKYERYIEKEEELVQRMSQLENMIIPNSFDYDKVTAISNEALQKFKKIKPQTLGQASRISGVNPSDVQILMVFMGR